MDSKRKTKEYLYPASYEEALEIQNALCGRVIIKPLGKKPRLIAAADAAFHDGVALAAACLYTYPELELKEIATGTVPLSLPYRPGFLSFCEGPAIYKTINSLNEKPELLLLDGQGIAHPRRLGLASFIGLLFGLPAIGCAKSVLVGSFMTPGEEAGSFTELIYKGEVVGYALRSRARTRPIFISPGHLINLEDSLKIVLSCLRGFRIPEPLRQAHLMTVKLKEQKK